MTAPVLAGRAPQPRPVERPQPATLDEQLAGILRDLTAVATTNIGYPSAVDIDYTPLVPFLATRMFNIGDPGTDTIYPVHVKGLEREVLAWHAELFNAPPGSTGYVTSGATEGNLYGLALARAALPTAVVYHSTAAHYSVRKACHLLGLPAVSVSTLAHGEMDYTDLQAHLSRYRHRPAIVVATVGTTMTEAIDYLPAIQHSLDTVGVTRRWIHADAALAGIPLALTGRREFDLAYGGADSLVVSGHKWWGTPTPSGIVLARHAPGQAGQLITYIGSHDTTITGCRSGLAVTMLWHAITRHDLAGHRQRAERALQVNDYAARRLTALGWPCWRNPTAITTMLRDLPEPLRPHWPLPSEQGWSHLICMPGVTTRHIDDLITALSASA